MDRTEQVIMTPEEKATLRDFALELALAKMQTLASVHAHLAAAVQQCRDYQKCMNTFESDAEIHELGEKIQALWWSLPRCGASLFEALTRRPADDFNYLDGNDVLRLRQKEAEVHGVDRVQYSK